MNADGYDDVVVGARFYDNGQNEEGRAYVFLGNAAGVQSSPVWTAESDQVSAYFGYCVSGAGDVNGDGYDDVIVGAHTYDNGQNDEGRAYVFLGQSSGVQSSPIWTGESDQADAQFGISVSGAGDVNGDGYDDVIVGASLYDNSTNNEGRAYVFLGQASGVQASATWTADGAQTNDQFGSSVSAAGDVNGDGYDDVIVGAKRYDNGQNDEGGAYVFLGLASGVQSSPAWTAESDQASAFFGWAVSDAGDVDADGYDDVVVGAALYDNGQNDEGRAYLFLGQAAGVQSSPAWIAEGDQAYAYFGFSVSGAGDVNGDGYDDVIVGSFLYDNGEANEGRAYLFFGQATVVQADLQSTAVWTAESDQNSAFFSRSVSGAGDVNNDGYDDVIVGSDHYDNDQNNEGRAYVFHGLAPTTTTTTTTTTTSSSSTTTSSSSTTTSSSSTTTTSSSSTTTTSSSSTTTTSSSSTTTTSSSSTTTTSSSSTTTTSSSSTTTTSSSSTTTTSSSSTTTSSSSSTTTTSSSSTTTTSSSSTTTTSSSSTTTSSSSSTTTTSSSSTTTTSSSSTTTTSSSSTTTTTPTTTSTTTTTAGGDDDTGDDDTGDDDTGDDDTGDDDTTDDDVDDDTGDDDTNDDDTSDDDTGGDDDDTVPLPDSDDDDDTQPGSRSSGDDDDDGGCGC
ncbi:MAG: integrin alpha [Deltaproteobacteria bacterium]|nr:integrin alpha [Deltaproteobacteria bacterium]